MLAIVLYLLLGSKAALAELLAELMICAGLLGGGGGGRLIRALQELRPRLPRPARSRLSHG
jgi:hypothetical protein